MKRAVAALLPFCLMGAALSSYVYTDEGARWPNGDITMHLQLGTDSHTFLDGSTGTWGDAVEPALGEWNTYLKGVAFKVVRNSTIPTAGGDRRNSVFWANDAFGDSLDAGVVAVTLSRWIGGERIEADVIFNPAYCWNSYRGAVRRTSPSTTCADAFTYDIRRVSLHEFGHVLGLGHPDEAGQDVRSIMNARVSEIESVQTDDASGVAGLYSGGGSTTSPSPTEIPINFPPRNEPVDFRNQLETKYRTGLRRTPTSTFVDVEGSVVWMQEYLRYRVNSCSHGDAEARVFSQIDGQGIQPVCASPNSVTFPPRNESLAFGSDLESKYRDGLRRVATGTYVDLEGNAVWTQEYLRLRVGGCSHAGAVASVFAQIDGTTPQCK